MDGLRFACVPGCTNCCEQKGWVYLSEADLEKAARYLGLSAADFEQRYVYRTTRRMRLRKPRRAQCHFLYAGGCRIHPAKPAQCRLFPFWPEIVESTAAWNGMTKVCPGIGNGPLVQIGEALETAEEMRRAYPALYPVKK